MELILINDAKLKIILNDADMEYYRLDCSCANYNNTETIALHENIRDSTTHILCRPNRNPLSFSFGDNSFHSLRTTLNYRASIMFTYLLYTINMNLSSLFVEKSKFL